jgi:hypothetical protein
VSEEIDGSGNWSMSQLLETTKVNQKKKKSFEK